MNGITHEHEELIRDLMRGTASKFHRGYSADNAAIAVSELHDLTDEERATLILHGYGFRDGIKRALDPEAAVIVVDEYPEWTPTQLASYSRGFDLGHNESTPKEVMLG